MCVCVCVCMCVCVCVCVRARARVPARPSNSTLRRAAAPLTLEAGLHLALVAQAVQQRGAVEEARHVLADLDIVGGDVVALEHLPAVGDGDVGAIAVQPAPGLGFWVQACVGFGV